MSQDTTFCDVCKTKFYEAPAILLGVPDEESKSIVYNICPVCFEWIIEQGAEK
jgi:hypothetical protein